jgi:hypothetical protein
MLQRCPEQYRRRYLLGEVARPGAALVWGSADHYAHEQNFRQKIESGTDIPVGDVKAAFAEGFDRAVERNGGEREVEWGDDKPGDLKDKGVELAAVYHDLVSPTVQPVAVEQKFEVRVPGVPVPVIGFVDVLEQYKAIERKTAARAQKTPKPDWLIQGWLYQSIERKPVEWHVSVKTKVPAIYTPATDAALRVEFDAAVAVAAQTRVRTFARVLTTYMAEFGMDEPWPDAVSHPWACGFCGFRPSCSWWGNGR